MAHHERVEAPNPVTSRYVDQPTGQARTHSAALPAILDEGRILGPSRYAGLAGVAYDRDDLIRVFGVERYQSRSGLRHRYVGEVLGLRFVRQLLHRTEEARDRWYVSLHPSVEALCRAGASSGTDNAER